MSSEQQSPQSVEEKVLEFLDNLADDPEFIAKIANRKLGHTLRKIFESNQGSQIDSSINNNTDREIMAELRQNRKAKNTPTKYELVMGKIYNNPGNLVTINELEPILGSNENAVAARLSKLNAKLKRHGRRIEHKLAYHLVPIDQD